MLIRRDRGRQIDSARRLGPGAGRARRRSLVRTGASQGHRHRSLSLAPAITVLRPARRSRVSPSKATRDPPHPDGAMAASRAFINDQPVSINLLRQIGGLLVEIHGQHDDRALVDVRKSPRSSRCLWRAGAPGREGWLRHWRGLAQGRRGARSSSIASRLRGAEAERDLSSTMPLRSCATCSRREPGEEEALARQPPADDECRAVRRSD